MEHNTSNQATNPESKTTDTLSTKHITTDNQVQTNNSNGLLINEIHFNSNRVCVLGTSSTSTPDQDSNNCIKADRINIVVGTNNTGKTQFLSDIKTVISGDLAQSVLVKAITQFPLNESQPKQLVTLLQNKNRLDLINGTFSDKVSLTECIQLEGDIFAEKLRKIVEILTDRQVFIPVDADRDGQIRYLMTQLSQNEQRTLIERVSRYISKIFDLGIQVTDRNIQWFNNYFGLSIVRREDDETKQIKDADIMRNLLDFQGEGVRAVAGILFTLMLSHTPIVLIDEPEVHLQPAAAFKFGQVLAELSLENRQVFITTHSSHFLKGLLTSNNGKDCKLLHFSSKGLSTQISSFDSEKLLGIVTNPIWSSSKVLDCLFHKAVVITEAESDSEFYQRLFYKVAGDDVFFIYTNGKGTISNILEQYHDLGIKFAAIFDADTIDSKDKTFSDLLQLFKPQEKEIERLRQRILCYLQQDNSRYNKLKKDGVCSLPNDPEDKFLQDKFLQDKAYKLIDLCQRYGIFIVPTGELESWFIDYKEDKEDEAALAKLNHISRKKKDLWIKAAIENMDKIRPDKNKKLWQFIDQLTKYLLSYSIFDDDNK